MFETPFLGLTELIVLSKSFFQRIGYNLSMRLLVTPTFMNLTDPAFFLADLLEPS